MDADGSGPVLLTGGSGRLGSELRALLPELIAPTRSELDVTNPESVSAALDRFRPATVVHAAAFTDVAAAEVDGETCWHTNVHGTRCVAAATRERGILLVHISTDYVFDGGRGSYREDDTPGPVRNFYALSKLVAEEIARLPDRHLVIRTSFRGRAWPHGVAFTDLWTSQDYVDVIAPQIALAIQNARRIPSPTLHIGTERKTMYDLARRRRPDVRPGLRSGAGLDLPQDVSLDVTRWEGIRKQLLAT